MWLILAQGTKLHADSAECIDDLYKVTGANGERMEFPVAIVNHSRRSFVRSKVA